MMVSVISKVKENSEKGKVSTFISRCGGTKKVTCIEGNKMRVKLSKSEKTVGFSIDYVMKYWRFCG